MSKSMKLVKHLANLGYGSRKEVAWMFREGRVTDAAGEVLYADDPLDHGNVRVDGEPLDPPQGLVLMLHKPAGYTCSTKDKGRIVYDLLPERFRLRDPVLSTVGRLDRETTGLLLMTDDGGLLHRIVSPKSKLAKVLHPIAGLPMISHIIKSAESLSPKKSSSCLRREWMMSLPPLRLIRLPSSPKPKALRMR